MKYSGELLQPKKGRAAVVTSWHWAVQTPCLLGMREARKAAPGKSVPTSHLSQEPQEFTRLFSFRGKEQGGKTDFADFVTLHKEHEAEQALVNQSVTGVCVLECVKVCLSVLTAAAPHSLPARKKKNEEKEWIFSQCSSHSKFFPHFGAQKETKVEGLSSSYCYDTQKETTFS